MTTTSDTKAALRKRMKALVRMQTPENILAAGIGVAQHIDTWLGHKNFQRAGIFLSLNDEIATAPLAAVLENHHIAQSWPHMHEQLLKFAPAGKLDIIFLPGLAFDHTGARLGRGGGHYDKYLSGLDQQDSRPILMGICLDEQLLVSLPTEKHDVIMDFVCTPQRGVQKAIPNKI